MLEGHPRSKERVLSGRAPLIKSLTASIGQGCGWCERSRIGVSPQEAGALEMHPRSRKTCSVLAPVLAEDGRTG